MLVRTALFRQTWALTSRLKAEGLVHQLHAALSTLLKTLHAGCKFYVIVPISIDNQSKAAYKGTYLKIDADLKVSCIDAKIM